jgi:hypothetical protein
MRYNYKGFRGYDSCCDIEVQRRNDDKYIFVATEDANKMDNTSSYPTSSAGITTE